ncbi:MAG: MipA/OmpV family protein, partial [Variovorax sp.]
PMPVFQAAAGPVSFRLRTRYGFDGYKPDDSDYLRGMERRKDSLWLGPAAAWNTGMGTLSFQWLGDTLGHSKATQWELQYDKRLDFGPLAVTPRVALHGLDRKYVDYHYGVRAAEATADRPAFAGERAYETEVGVRLTYRLDDRQTLLADFGGRRLGEEIRRSPLLARGYRASVFTGYAYRF